MTANLVKHFKYTFETSVYGHEGNDVAIVWGRHHRRVCDVIGRCETAAMLSALAFGYLNAPSETLRYKIEFFMIMLQHHHTYC